MSIFNILDDVYDVESPMEKIMSAAKKKKDKSVTVTKKEKDPFLDGFNLFANEEKKEKSHLDSVSSRGKSHIQKAKERLSNMKNILKRETLDTVDEKIIRGLVEDLENALEGK